MSGRRLPMFQTEARPALPDEPALLGLPSILARRGLEFPDQDDLSPRVRALLVAVKDALRAPPSGPVVFSLDELPPDERAALWDMLGEGEVSIVVQGAARYEIEETSLPGVYRVRTRRDGTESLHLEVGAVPAVVAAAAEHGTSREVPIEDPPPPGLMNAQPLLAELRHRVATLDPAAPNHVVSLSLLPLNDADATYLSRALGMGPIAAESRGYGTCRVAATSRRAVWAVQYFNAMDQLVLDTLEIGGVPAALIAAPVDLEDSGTRLAALLEASS
ncbi:MAG: hydrogenase expression/formation protein [Labilithrix sp.]